MVDESGGKFAGRDEPPIVGTATPPQHCVLDDRRPGARALVTGASSGIGKVYAQRLAVQGWALTLVARSTERLEELRRELEESHGVDVRIITADLVERSQLTAVEKEIRGDASLDLVINNAGGALVQTMVDGDIDDMDALLQLNATALTRLTAAALPGMIERGRGAIVNVSSAGAFVCVPGSAVYCASKAYVSSFTEAVHGETEGTGVQVQALCPGMTSTELHIRGNFDVSWVESWMMPEDVVDASLQALRMGEVVCVPGLQDPGLVTEMRTAGASIVGQTINSVVADRYKTPQGV